MSSGYEHYINKVVIIILINPRCLDQNFYTVNNHNLIVVVTSVILCRDLNVVYRLP